VLMGKYFPNIVFFNFKTGSIDMIWLGEGLLHGCFPFHFYFRGRSTIGHNILIIMPSRTIAPNHYFLGGIIQMRDVNSHENFKYQVWKLVKASWVIYHIVTGSS
jgi:hypothetical protein